jgi:hypothetical protein
MEAVNHTYNILFNSISDGAKMNSDLTGLKNISYYDIRGRRIRMAGKSKWEKGIYIASFSNKQERF